MAGVVIIGAGECGVRAAFALREQGFDGPVTLLGAETSLPYERPPLSKSTDGEAKAIRPRESYEESEINLCLGMRVEKIYRESKTIATSGGETLHYEKLLLATGAEARLFPGLEECKTFRTDLDAERILQRLTPGATVGIIGGGFIGLELAATARQQGTDVTVFEAGPRLLARAVPEAIAAVVHERHETEGVTLLTGADVAKADARTVTLADGCEYTYDVVVAGVGSVPSTHLAQGAGLSVENGIVVDGDFRTSDANIYAAGDCCNFVWRGARVRLESWKAAQDQGAHVAAAMLGASDGYTNVPWFWSDQYDLSLQVTGLFDQSRAVYERITGRDDVTLVFQCEDGGRVSAAAGIGPGNAIAKDIKIFEKLIERGADLDPSVVAKPSFNLKQLLRTA